MHDEGGLQAGFDPIHFFQLNPFLQALQLLESHIQCLLGAFVGGARVTNHAGAIFEGLVTSPNGVAQPALLAHFREQPSAHAA